MELEGDNMTADILTEVITKNTNQTSVIIYLLSFRTKNIYWK
jgi:hypothetical protein